MDLSKQFDVVVSAFVAGSFFRNAENVQQNFAIPRLKTYCFSSMLISGEYMLQVQYTLLVVNLFLISFSPVVLI